MTSKSSDELEVREVPDETENFLLGGAGGLRLVALLLPKGVLDLEPGMGVRDDIDRLDAADPGLSVGSGGACWLSVSDSETSFSEDWRTGSRDV